MRHSIRAVVAGLLLLSSLSSCLNKETPVPAHDPGDVLTSAVSIGEDYKMQVYYSLKNNTVVGQNEKTVWDLGFETSADGWHIVLNSSKVMKVYVIDDTDFAAVSMADTSGKRALMDMPSGSLDSTAIGNWRTSNNIYIIDRGMSETGMHQGYVKFRIRSCNTSGFTIQFSSMEESTAHMVAIPKDEQYNFSFLSFNDGGKIVAVEPPKEEWDIAFSQYTHIYYDLDNMPYSVVGCLLNRHHTSAILLDSSQNNFQTVTLDKVTGVSLSSFINAIGFDWKAYTGTKYVINTNKTYILRDARGAYYKLRFVDFYKSGVKGNPAFEYQAL